MTEDFELMGLNNFNRINRVSLTDYDFMDQRPSRIKTFAKYRDEETVPPADRNIFDHPPDVDVDDDHYYHDHYHHGGYHAHDFDALRLPSLEWSHESVHFDDDTIHVLSHDSEMKWSEQNRLVTSPTVRDTSAAAAAAVVPHASPVGVASVGGEATIHGAQLSILEELKRMSRKQTLAEGKHEEWISESDITDNDVICERGGKSNRHAGTKRYRGIVEKYKPIYQSMTAKVEKTNLSRKIIAQIHDSKGRFLKRDEQTGQFFVLCKVETTKKVSQALREKKVLKWTDDKL